MSPCQPPARFTCKDADPLGPAVGDLDGGVCPTSRREEGEGWDGEQAKRLEDRNRWFRKGVPMSEVGSRWDSMELKSGNVPVPVIDTVDSEVNMKWTELESLSFRDMSAQSLIGAEVHRSSALQRSLSHLGSQAGLSSQEVRISEPAKSTQAAQTSTAERPETEVGETLVAPFIASPVLMPFPL